MTPFAALGNVATPTEQFVELWFGGAWYRFPVVPGVLLAKQPMTPFSPAVQRGNSQRVIDRRMNVRVWDDFTGGIGELRTDPNRGLTNYYYGTLNTREPGVVTLPYKLTSVGNVGGSLTRPVRVESMPAHSGLFVWSPNTGQNYYKIGAGAWTQALAGFRVHAFVRWNGAYYISVDTGGTFSLYKSTNGSTWTSVAGTTSYYGLTVHDNALFSVDQANLRLVKTTDGTTFSFASSAIGAAGSGVVRLEPGEGLRQLLTWDTPSGQQQTVYLLTTRRLLVLEEEPGYWHDFYQDYPFDGTHAWAHPWRRNNYVYLTFYSATDPNAIVLVHNGNTTDEVGPRAKGSLPEDYLHGVGFVTGNVHNLYGCGIGGTINGVFSKGNVVAMNDLGGWHPVMAGEFMSNGTSYVVGMGYYNQTVYAAMSNGDIFSITDPDRRMVHPRSGTGIYDTNPHKLYSSYDDDGLQNVWKVGAYFVVDAQFADGSHGIPLGSSVKLRYRVDGGAWQTLPLLGNTSSDPIGLLAMLSVRPSSAVWPVVQVLPDGVQQLGIPYKRIQWELTEQNAGNGPSPAVTAISLYYTLWLEQYYSLQVPIDFREETWRQFPEGKLDGNEREYMQALLDTISRHKGYIQVRYGHDQWQQTITAADMLLTHSVEPGVDGAVTRLTVRDLTAPAS